MVSNLVVGGLECHRWMVDRSSEIDEIVIDLRIRTGRDSLVGQQRYTCRYVSPTEITRKCARRTTHDLMP